LKELDQFLNYDFFERFGGGIGVTRMITALEKSKLLNENMDEVSILKSVCKA